MVCEVCGQPVESGHRMHVNCELRFHEFMQDDFVPMIQDLKKENPHLLAYALSPEWRQELRSVFPIRDLPIWS